MATKKVSYVGVPEVFSLGHCCNFIARAFGEHTCYLVGSATERPDFRDVDVVLILGDEKWRALFGTTDNGEVLPFWTLTMTALSEYIAKRTGLKVDFKVQSMTQANSGPHEGKQRQPIGLMIDHADPLWSKMEWNSPAIASWHDVKPAISAERANVKDDKNG